MLTIELMPSWVWILQTLRQLAAEANMHWLCRQLAINSSNLLLTIYRCGKYIYFYFLPHLSSHSVTCLLQRPWSHTEYLPIIVMLQTVALELNLSDLIFTAFTWFSNLAHFLKVPWLKMNSGSKAHTSRLDRNSTSALISRYLREIFISFLGIF